MRPPKAKPGDERLIHDETADWADRSSALSRLTADRRLDLEMSSGGRTRLRRPGGRDMVSIRATDVRWELLRAGIIALHQ